jgi:CheY-like chemotaxis protein
VPDTTAPRVLLIEDDPSVRDSVHELLDYFGYQCGIAADGQTALQRFHAETWDLVITDLTLPGMTGWQVVEAIRARAPSVPVILITGDHDPEIGARARQCRVSLLPKPFGLDALKAVLVDALYAPSRWTASRRRRTNDRGFQRKVAGTRRSTATNGRTRVWRFGSGSSPGEHPMAWSAARGPVGHAGSAEGSSRTTRPGTRCSSRTPALPRSSAFTSIANASPRGS